MRDIFDLILYAAESGFGRAATRRTTRTAETVVYGVTTVAEDMEVSQANVRVVLTKPSDLAGDILLSYTLEDDRAQTASITPQYSTDNGVTFSTMTDQGGGDGTTGLTTSATAPGQAHTFEWDSVTDLGIDFKGDVLIRIKAFDQNNQLGDFEFSADHKLQIDNAPLISTLVSPIDGFFDKNETPTFVFTISDPGEGNSDMHVKLELDIDDSFTSGSLQTFESRNDQIGWEYDSDGAGAWLPIPASGIPVIATPVLIGRQARFTVQTPQKLSKAKFFWKITFGGVTS